MYYYGGLFNEYRQNIDIGRAQSKASTAQNDVHMLREEFERRLGKLAMITQAMWSLLQEKHAMTEEQLVAKVREIDLSDGVEDGRVAKKQAKECPQCNRVMSRLHQKCLYCGAAGLLDTVFDGI